MTDGSEGPSARGRRGCLGRATATLPLPRRDAPSAFCTGGRRLSKHRAASSLSRAPGSTGFTAPTVLSPPPVLCLTLSYAGPLHTRGQGRRRRCERLQVPGRRALGGRGDAWGRPGQLRRAPASGCRAGERKVAVLVFARGRPLAFLLLGGRRRPMLDESNLSRDSGV